MDNQQNNFEFLMFIHKKIWMLKFGSFFLLILMVINVILHYRDNRRNLREKESLHEELTLLKARLYDLQEEVKAKPAEENPTN